jgi:hypothetical protein
MGCLGVEKIGKKQCLGLASVLKTARIRSSCPNAIVQKCK